MRSRKTLIIVDRRHFICNTEMSNCLAKFRDNKPQGALFTFSFSIVRNSLSRSEHSSHKCEAKSWRPPAMLSSRTDMVQSDYIEFLRSSFHRSLVLIKASWSSGMILALGYDIANMQEAPRSNRGGALCFCLFGQSHHHIQLPFPISWNLGSWIWYWRGRTKEPLANSILERLVSPVLICSQNRSEAQRLFPAPVKLDRQILHVFCNSFSNLLFTICSHAASINFTSRLTLGSLPIMNIRT